MLCFGNPLNTPQAVGAQEHYYTVLREFLCHKYLNIHVCEPSTDDHLLYMYVINLVWNLFQVTLCKQKVGVDGMVTPMSGINLLMGYSREMCKF